MLRTENSTVSVDVAQAEKPALAFPLRAWPDWGKIGVRFPRGGFVRSVFLLAGGTAAGQAILVLSAPVLTRIYRPEDLGVLALFISTVSLLAVMAALRYDVAIPLPRDESQAANVFVLSLVCVCAMTALTCLAILLFGESLVMRFGGETMLPFLWLVPLGLFGAGLHRVLNTWLVRQRDYSQLAATSIIQAVCQAACQIGIGLAISGPVGLLVGDVAGRTSCGGTLLRRCWRTSGAALRQTSPRGVMQAAARYWRFPVLSSWAAFLNTAGIYLPPVLFAFYYDLEVVGWLALSQRIIGTPTTLLSNSVAKVYFSECSRLRHDAPEKLPRLFWKTVVSQSVAAALIVVCVALPAPLVCGFVFGEEWRAAGWCVLILSAMYAAKIIAYPLGSTLDVLEMQGLHIFRELVRLALMVTAVAVAGLLHLRPLEAIAVLSVASCLAYSIGILIVWQVIRGVTPHEA